jgi:tetratricopeptide (TPR) repeat protein
MNDLQYVLRTVTPGRAALLLQLSARFCAAAGLVFCSYWSLRLTVADFWAQSQEMSGLQTAAALAPGNSQYLLRLGELTRFAGGSALESFRAASAANPRDAAIWTALGFASEESGDFRAAEGYFLKAAALDHQFEAKWTLAGFYLRHQSSPEFWRWTKSALSIGRGDLSPLFDSMWRMSNDSAFIQSQLPRRAPVLTGYFSWLVYNGHPDAAYDVAPAALAVAGPNEKNAFVALCEQMLLARRRPDEAWALWKGILNRKLLPGASWDPRSNMLFDGEFLQPPLNAGFGWRTPPVDGVNLSQGGGLEFDFSGKQPESCTLLQQFVTVTPGESLEFHCRYHANGIAPGTGLYWRMIDAETGRPFASVDLGLSGGGDGDAHTDIHIPDGVRRMLASLSYQRTPGTVRIDGDLTLVAVSLKAGR